MKNQSVFIIAEAGVNHNGNVSLAKKLVDVAKKAGADAVKFQTFKSEDLVTNNAKMAEYAKKNTKKIESQITMLKRLELPNRDFVELKKYCDRKGIIFLSTPHTESVIDFLDSLMPAFKIASGDLTNLPLIEKMAKKKKWIILFTGLVNLQEIREAFAAIRKFSKKKISLLHCTANYPCPINQVNLRAMISLQKKFEKKFAPLEIGYSDHTQGIMVSVAAVAMGACVLEKHFTLDRTLPGPDHKASLEPQELEAMVEAVRNIEIALGDGVKKPTESENKIKEIARKSIITNRDIKKGQTIKREMLAIKRPGTGIAPKYVGRVMGMTARKNLRKGVIMRFKDLK